MAAAALRSTCLRQGGLFSLEPLVAWLPRASWKGVLVCEQERGREGREGRGPCAASRYSARSLDQPGEVDETGGRRRETEVRAPFARSSTEHFTASFDSSTRPNSTPRGRPRCDVTAFLVPIRACDLSPRRFSPRHPPEPGRAWRPSLFKGACQGPAMALTHTLRTNES